MHVAPTVKVIITGITGLIGSAVKSLLVQSGHEVVGVSRSAGPNLIQWDLDERKIDAAAIEGADAIVHLAGETIAGRWTDAKKQRILESRTTSTQLLADTVAGLDSPPSVFVSGSAVGYYGNCGDEVVDESAPVGDAFLSDVCQRWEAAADPAREAGVRVVHPRTGIVLDPSGGALKPLILATKLFVGGKLGSGRQMWSWISLEDEARAIVHLIESELAGPVNLTAPNPASQFEVAKELAGQLGRPSFVPTPKFALELVMGQMAEELIFQSCAAVPRVLLEDGFEFSHPDLASGIASALV